MPPRVTVKPGLIIFHDAGDWSAIYSQILKDYGMGMAVRTKLRRELGFSYRRHDSWIKVPAESSLLRREDQVHLDFYTKAAQTWFTLKYLGINDSGV